MHTAQWSTVKSNLRLRHGHSNDLELIHCNFTCTNVGGLASMQYTVHAYLMNWIETVKCTEQFKTMDRFKGHTGPWPLMVP